MRKVKLTADSKKDLLNNLLKRSPNNYSEYESTVADIIADVRANKDQAVFSYTRKFDKWEIDETNIRVTPAEMDEAFAAIDEEFVRITGNVAIGIPGEFGFKIRF